MSTVGATSTSSTTVDSVSGSPSPSYPSNGWNGFGPSPSQSSTYLQSVIISLVALALILIISVIFLYYRRQRLQRYAAADWPFPRSFRANVRGTGGTSSKDFGEKPEMWEVEIIEPKGQDHEEDESIKGKGAALRVDPEFEGSKRTLSELAFSESEVSTWRPLGAAAMVPITTAATALSIRELIRNPPIITTTSTPSSSNPPNREQAAEEALASIHTGSSVQVSVLVAMPVPEAVRLRRKSKASHINDDDEELPELEIGYTSIDVDEDVTNIIHPLRRAQDGTQSDNRSTGGEIG